MKTDQLLLQESLSKETIRLGKRRQISLLEHSDIEDTTDQPQAGKPLSDPSHAVSDLFLLIQR